MDSGKAIERVGLTAAAFSLSGRSCAQNSHRSTILDLTEELSDGKGPNVPNGKVSTLKNAKYTSLSLDPVTGNEACQVSPTLTHS